MKVLLAVFALMVVPFDPTRPGLPPKPPRHMEKTPKTALDETFKKLSLPCPDRVHINDIPSREEGSRFGYRPHDMYDDCADEMDALVRTREPVDERLLKLGIQGKELPERYRAAWVLIQRRNGKVVSVLKKMAASSSAEERYLTWHAYKEAIWKRQLAVPPSFEAALAHCRNERNNYVRGEVMGFLGECRAKEAVPLLTAALDDDTGYSAVQALGNIRDPKSAPAVLARAKKETLNRHIYFGVLGRIGTPEAVDYLLEHLDEGCFAMEALFESGSRKALPALEKCLNRLKKMKKPEGLDLAVAQVSVLRLKYKDPREQLIALAEDRKQSQWMRSRALEALGHYDKKPLADRILKLYRTDKNDWMRIDYIRLLSDIPGQDITEAMIDQALTDKKDQYYFCHTDLVQALNQRLNTSFRDMTRLVEYLRHERAAKQKEDHSASLTRP
jgi:HEAT repeat protein